MLFLLAGEEPAPDGGDAEEVGGAVLFGRGEDGVRVAAVQDDERGACEEVGENETVGAAGVEEWVDADADIAGMAAGGKG